MYYICNQNCKKSNENKINIINHSDKIIKNNENEKELCLMNDFDEREN